MHELLVKCREAAGLRPHEVVSALGIDKGLFSKFESGARIPTREQLTKFSLLYKVGENELLLPWLILKIESVVAGEPLAAEALRQILEKINPTHSGESDLQKILREMEAIKAAVNKKD